MRPASAMARNRIPRHMEAIMTAPASAIEGVLFCQLLLAAAYATLSDDFSSSPLVVCARACMEYTAHACMGTTLKRVTQKKKYRG